jgi:hypothetical protein
MDSVAWVVLVVVLGLVVIGQVGLWAVLVQVVQQQGRILIRLDELAHAGRPAGGHAPRSEPPPSIPPRGLAVGSTIGDFRLPDLAGRPIGPAAWRGRRTRASAPTPTIRAARRAAGRARRAWTRPRRRAADGCRLVRRGVMKSIRVACVLGILLGLAAVAPAAADDGGCARALNATWGTPGYRWVRSHCGQADAGVAIGAQAAAQGCAQGIAATQGTTAEPFVRAGCARAAASLGAAADQGGPGPSDQGSATSCAIAHNETAGTAGQAYVDAFCPGATGGTATAPATVGAQNAAAGCALAIQSVANTTAEPFVRAGCARAVANAAAGTSGDEGGDGGQGSDDDGDGGSE